MSLTETLTAIKTNSESLLSFANQTTGHNDPDLGEAVKTLCDGFVSGGGLPSGITKIAFGEYEVETAFTTSRQTVTHDLGVIPDLVMFWHDGNVATTYSMLMSLRCTKMGYRSSAYTLYNVYHGNSTTNVSVQNSNSTSYGVSNFTVTTFNIASNSASYYWRAGTYKWLAIKF